MGFWNSMFGDDRIENENKTKPFFKNANALERKDWFTRTRPWHKVPPAVIDAVIAKLDADPLVFEVFVHTSMQQRLVERYEKLDPSHGPLNATIIAGILSQVGSTALQAVMTLKQAGRASDREVDRAVEAGKLAAEAFEVAVLLDRNMIMGYSGLAVILGMMGRHADALQRAKQGIEVIREIRQSGTPFHASSIESVREAPQMLEQSERMLTELIQQYEAL
ncbi:hypothetical protein [Anaeromyxobacter oryzisoli]|uniref:hypothetical protein n=1 Tax=Anaeromyxobacter oryzisoli TaxID=2925408 RepID=UPI001F589B7B|nr:hypothetical protein [Anaeromyxobacter sp. SG63]